MKHKHSHEHPHWNKTRFVRSIVFACGVLVLIYAIKAQPQEAENTSSMTADDFLDTYIKSRIPNDVLDMLHGNVDNSELIQKCGRGAVAGLKLLPYVRDGIYATDTEEQAAEVVGDTFRRNGARCFPREQFIQMTLNFCTGKIYIANQKHLTNYCSRVKSGDVDYIERMWGIAQQRLTATNQ